MKLSVRALTVLGLAGVASSAMAVTMTIDNQTQTYLKNPNVTTTCLSSPSAAPVIIPASETTQVLSGSALVAGTQCSYVYTIQGTNDAIYLIDTVNPQGTAGRVELSLDEVQASSQPAQDKDYALQISDAKGVHTVCPQPGDSNYYYDSGSADFTNIAVRVISTNGVCQES